MIDAWLKSNRNYLLAWVVTLLAMVGSVNIYIQTLAPAQRVNNSAIFTK